MARKSPGSSGTRREYAALVGYYYYVWHYFTAMHMQEALLKAQRFCELPKARVAILKELEVRK